MRAPRLIPRSIAVLFVASLAAATCDDGRPEVPLAEQFAKAFCAHQFNCCSPYEMSLVTSDRYKTEEQCLPFATLAARQQLGAIEGAIAQGRISVDPAKLDACVAAYRDGACNTSLQAPMQISAIPDLGIALTYCPDLLVGHVSDNQACNLTQECVPGSRCTGGAPRTPPYGYYPGLTVPVQLTPSPGLCIPYQKDGAPCNDSSDCDPSHSCRTPEFVCGPPTGEGEPCASTFNPLTGVATSNCDASAGLFCDEAFTFTCRHFPRAGEPCNQLGAPQCDPDPALALSCEFFSGICKKPGVEGDACGGAAIPPCREDLACHATQGDGIGICGVLPTVGEACTDRCASPGVCVGGVCGTPGSTPVGSPCNGDSECASLSCSGFLSGRFVCAAIGIMPRCVGADVTPGNISGFGGNTGVGGRGPIGVGGSFTTGTGGRSTTGAGGAGGGPPIPRGCAFSDPPPQGPLVADFEGADGTAVVPIGGTFTYAAPNGGSGPAATITGGALHVTATTTGTVDAQYWGAGIYFNGNPAGTDCIDALGFKGIQFDVSGSVSGTGCTMQYSTNDSAHMDSSIDPKGSGPPGSYPPQASLAVTPTPTTVMMPFDGPGGPTGGSPAIAVDPFRLVGVQWQFTTAAGTDNSCLVDVTIDNVRFF